MIDITMEQVREYMANTKSPVQLVLNYDEANQKNLTWPAWAEKKEDGVWCGVVKTSTGEVAFFSRTGNEFYQMLCIDVFSTRNAPDMSKVKPGMYVAELINPLLTLEELSGLVLTNRVVAWTANQLDAMADAELRFHDYIPLDHLIAGYSHHSLKDRKFFLAAQVPTQHIIQGLWVDNEEEWRQCADQHIALGNEGAVLKQLDADWVAGHKGYRVTKLVRGLDVDLRCIGVCLEGKGKRAGTLSKLYVAYHGKQVGCDLGKGWDGERRAQLLVEYKTDPSSVVGQVWHIHALQAGSKGGLRLPKAMSRRIDKTIADDEV